MPKTVKLGSDDATVRVDESDVIVRFVDAFTELVEIEGAVYLGLGCFVGSLEKAAKDDYVKDVIHLRMTRQMAGRVHNGLGRLLAPKPKTPN